VCNDEKIKETIRRYANAAQASLTRLSVDLNESTTSFNNKSINNSDAYDLSNDPDIKKYFQQSTNSNKSDCEPVKPQSPPLIFTKPAIAQPAAEEEEEEKLIDFSDFREALTTPTSAAPPPAITANFNYYNKNIINNSMSEPLISNKTSNRDNFTFTGSFSAASALLKPERKHETIESIIDEFDPIKSSSMANSMSQQHQYNNYQTQVSQQNIDLSNFVAKPYIPKPNYNIALPLLQLTPQRPNYNLNNQITQFNQNNNLQQHSNPLVSETIARFNRNAISQHNQWVNATPRQQQQQSTSTPSSFQSNPTNLIKK